MQIVIKQWSKLAGISIDFVNDSLVIHLRDLDGDRSTRSDGMDDISESEALDRCLERKSTNVDGLSNVMDP